MSSNEHLEAEPSEFARYQARQQDQYEAHLRDLGRITLSRALQRVAAAGKREPWRWLSAKISDGALPAFGTIGKAQDQPVAAAWLGHVDIEMCDQNGVPTDNCVWLIAGHERPRRVSDFALELAPLELLLGGHGAETETLKRVSDAEIHKAITAVYDSAAAAKEKPPNVNEIIKPVLELLRAAGYNTSGNRVRTLAGDKRYSTRRRKIGPTVANEKAIERR